MSNGPAIAADLPLQVPPAAGAVARWPLPHLSTFNGWIVRLLALLARRRVLTIHGLEHAQSIRDLWTTAGKPKNIRLLFSAHGLPEVIVQRFRHPLGPHSPCPGNGRLKGRIRPPLSYRPIPVLPIDDT